LRRRYLMVRGGEGAPGAQRSRKVASFGHQRGRFYAANAYEIRSDLKYWGWKWDPEAKVWWTANPDALRKALEDKDIGKGHDFGGFADEAILTLPAATRKALYSHLPAERVERLRAAQAETQEAPLPEADVPTPPGRTFFRFQRQGVGFLLTHPKALLADEQGLGKTAQVLGVVNADQQVRRVLIVCPPSVTGVWRAEAERWLTRSLNVGVATAKDLPDTDMVIVHWAVVARHEVALRQRDWDLIALDECHWAKNPRAQRTRAVLGGRGRRPLTARRQIALSGTPIPNRPIELQPIVQWLWPEQSWVNWFYYAREYCNGYKNRWGWVVDGASNLAGLRFNLKQAGMLRRRKAEVLTDLPAKIRRLVPLAADTPDLRAALRAEEKALKELRKALAAKKAGKNAEQAANHEYVAAVQQLGGARLPFDLGVVSELRHATAKAKAPIVSQHILDVLEDGVGKLIVFAHHHDVVEIIRQAMDEAGVGCVVMTGETPLARRAELVEKFQTDETVRVFIGGIYVASEGITLTSASHVVFAELDWVPGKIAQAEDRAHRIGQQDSVLVEHVVLERSIDARLAAVLVEKAEVAAAALGDSAEVADDGPDATLLAAALGIEEVKGEEVAVAS